jgi:hypothetical protein
VASIALGSTFGPADQIECGDYFNEAAIRKALDKVFERELEPA